MTDNQGWSNAQQGQDDMGNKDSGSQGNDQGRGQDSPQGDMGNMGGNTGAEPQEGQDGQTSTDSTQGM